jgi:signal transduction histidine kinase
MVDRRSAGFRARIRALSGSVRVRTTAAAVVVVGVALIVAAIAMVVLLRRSLTDNVRSSALLRAGVVASELQSADGGEVIAGGDREEEFVQVVDSNGDVVGWSQNLTGEPAVVSLRPGDSKRVQGLPFENEPFLAAAISADSPNGPVTVIVGQSLEDVTESTQAVVGLLAVGVPVILLVVGCVTWLVVGRALAPVESIRSEVEAISTEALHRRVPDPAGTDEIANLASTMNRMLGRLERGQQRQRQFVSDASHELRSPVAAIRQHAEVALTHPGEMTSEELAAIVLEENSRLQRLVEDLLLLARVDEATLSLRKESVDLDDLLFEEADRLRALGTLSVDTGSVSAGRVAGDRRQLGNLVRNLSDNASRHAHSKVVFGLRNGDGKIVLTVDDDGDGIPLSDRERVFERFVRLDSARDRDSGGSGLGLAIVAEIAAAHGATVEVDDGVAGGARISVEFPSGE